MLAVLSDAFALFQLFAYLVAGPFVVILECMCTSMVCLAPSQFSYISQTSTCKVSNPDLERGKQRTSHVITCRVTSPPLKNANDLAEFCSRPPTSTNPTI